MNLSAASHACLFYQLLRDSDAPSYDFQPSPQNRTTPRHRAHFGQNMGPKSNESTPVEGFEGAIWRKAIARTIYVASGSFWSYAGRSAEY
jgi:hypothetical protein